MRISQDLTGFGTSSDANGPRSWRTSKTCQVSHPSDDLAFLDATAGPDVGDPYCAPPPACVGPGGRMMQR